MILISLDRGRFAVKSAPAFNLVFAPLSNAAV